MFEDKFAEPVTLQIPAGNYVDGLRSWQDFPGRAVIMDAAERDLSRYGRIKNTKIFLLRAEATPTESSRLLHQGVAYDLKEVKVCRNVDGAIEGYRCRVMS